MGRERDAVCVTKRRHLATFCQTPPQTRSIITTPIGDEAFIMLLVGCVAVGLFLFASVLVPNFFQLLNMLNLVTNNWAVISLGIGVSFLLVSGNFDLSYQRPALLTPFVDSQTA